MITSILIIVLSVAMFAYWFRYTCVLILSAKMPRDHSTEVAERLNMLTVREALTESGDRNTARIQSSLNRDYHLVTGLLRTASMDSIESAILKIDYWLMGAWCTLSGRVAPGQARRALLEMSSIIVYLANLAGQSASAE